MARGQNQYPETILELFPGACSYVGGSLLFAPKLPAIRQDKRFPLQEFAMEPLNPLPHIFTKPPISIVLLRKGSVGWPEFPLSNLELLLSTGGVKARFQ